MSIVPIKHARIIDEENLTIHKEDGSLGQEEQIEQIRFHFSAIMELLGLDLTDDSLKDTPGRVAKMYVQETFRGLDERNFPRISVFNNTYGYSEMLVEKDIQVYSCCEHHFLPFIGSAHVAYFPGEKVIGLSKINRIVDFFCRRPQLQERLTSEIAASLKHVLQTEDVAVFIEARHLCVAARGVEDSNSLTVTSSMSGRFKHPSERDRFYQSFRTNS